jgi:Tol biopolymer transport system component
MNADGTHMAQLTTANGNSGSPEWSPDGTRIVFDHDASGFENKGIFSMKPDGSDVRQLTSGHYDKQPTWSPDGKRVAFVRGNAGQTELFVVNADGSETEQITSGIKSVSDPTWSPDGNSLAFSLVTDSRMCTDDYYGDATTSYPCGYDVMRISLAKVMDPVWVLFSAYNAAWQH